MGVNLPYNMGGQVSRVKLAKDIIVPVFKQPRFNRPACPRGARFLLALGVPIRGLAEGSQDSPETKTCLLSRQIALC